MKWKVKATPEFYRSLVRGAQDVMEETFALSQKYCPVDKGTLKKSGVLELTERGAVIRYRTSYAEKQEFGLPPGATEAIPQHTVRAHRRKRHLARIRKTGKVVRIPAQQVESHERGPYVKTYEKGLEGRFYLTRAWDEVRPRWAQFLERQLRR